MNKEVEKFLKHMETSASTDSRIINFIKLYDEKYREKLCHIATTKDEDELYALYEKEVREGTMSTDNAISYAFASNPHLPKDIVNTICFESIPDTSFYRPLFENNKDKMNESTFKTIYDKESYMISSPIGYLKYKDKSLSKTDLPYSEEMMSWIAEEEFTKSFSPIKYTFRNDVSEIFRFLPSEECYDNLIDQIRKSSENKEAILTQLLNNEFVSEAKRDAIFDEFGCDFKELKNPTPHMVELIYESTVATVFHSDMTRYSTKTSEESRIYYDSVFILGDLARYGKLNSGMQLDLMNMLMERKDRSSESLTRELVCGTNDPRVLHLALNLKSTNDKDSAIENKHMAPEDLLTVAKISKKKIDTELKKATYASPKHRKRLLDIATRITLPDEIYETMFRMDESATGNVLSSSPYSPRHIIERTLRDALDPSVRTRTPQEMQARLMLFTIDNSLPMNKTMSLMEMLYLDSQKDEPKGFEHFRRKQEYTNFITDNPNIEQYKEFIKELQSTLISEDYRKAAERVLKGIEEIKTWKPEERKEQLPHEMTDRRLDEKKRACELSISAGINHSNQASLYLTLEEIATEYNALKEEADRRLALKLEEMAEER